ncbi:hypothetical protein LCGC14_1713580 [marine sediment metagenome]|uniref:Uncharacterized protein n=1 Tax=marine sediment metagenome TaxID=412755 RepID=A0A0F9HEY7_9ZZZZ
MQFKDINIDANLKFHDISSEEWREYEFDGAKIIRIEKPIALNISKTGGHRLVDSAGISHYVPRGWKHLSWKADPQFVL